MSITDYFAFGLVIVFITEALLFITMVVKKRQINDYYFNTYKEANLFSFTSQKAILIAFAIYMVYFPGGLVLKSGPTGGYVLGVLYTIIALKFAIRSIVHLVKSRFRSVPLSRVQYVACSMNIYERMVLGGIIGSAIAVLATWFYLIVFVGGIFVRLHIFSITGTIAIAITGFGIGAFLSIFSRKWDR
jgi:hypothetical protein